MLWWYNVFVGIRFFEVIVFLVCVIFFDLSWLLVALPSKCIKIHIIMKGCTATFILKTLDGWDCVDYIDSYAIMRRNGWANSKREIVIDDEIAYIRCYTVEWRMFVACQGELNDGKSLGYHLAMDEIWIWYCFCSTKSVCIRAPSNQ